MEFLEDRLGSDHKPMLLTLTGLTHAWSKATETREVWRLELIPHWKDVKALDAFVKQFHNAFKKWVGETETLLASKKFEKTAGDV